MPRYQSGDIVLAIFPFTDLHEHKKRPGLVLLDTDDSDVILARITSKILKSQFDVSIIQWAKAGLVAPSVVRLHKVIALHKTRIYMKLGELGGSDWSKVQKTGAAFYKTIFDA